MIRKIVKVGKVKRNTRWLTLECGHLVQQEDANTLDKGYQECKLCESAKGGK